MKCLKIIKFSDAFCNICLSVISMQYVIYMLYTRIIFKSNWTIYCLMQSFDFETRNCASGWWCWCWGFATGMLNIQWSWRLAYVLAFIFQKKKTKTKNIDTPPRNCIRNLDYGIMQCLKRMLLIHMSRVFHLRWKLYIYMYSIL